ncbi:hypothetical protein M877_32705 [Streptomyces niveus NCIMB 11891]|nr:hypothetical protein M877_32705 [Streptomyces niveus NCIMB 11891]
MAERLRTAPYAHAVERLRLRVTGVDLRVTALLEKEPDADLGAGDCAAAAEPVEATGVAPEGTAAAVAANVPGVAGCPGRSDRRCS